MYEPDLCGTELTFNRTKFGLPSFDFLLKQIFVHESLPFFFLGKIKLVNSRVKARNVINFSTYRTVAIVYFNFSDTILSYQTFLTKNRSLSLVLLRYF